MTTLFDSAPGFDQPIAVLKHCHDRIRKQLATLEKLLAHLPVHGADQEAQQAAQALLKYFTQAAPLHHEDEEMDLLPTLETTAKAEDAELLNKLLPEILKQHLQMTAQWTHLEKQLKQIQDGSSAQLSQHDVRQFSEIYQQHMQTEETHIAPMAKRLFSEAQMQKLGAAMQARRGIPPSSH
ncbi:hemerythrin domain-containing protein [Undibacterium sp. Jales W-56]|uniref:hemerythrin domain-containing protein n=1 Tax=Undibacterium sp. Jales W-56 TaxID=2897325 RepID=UPI0021D0D89A|nr:hemerythrin domain-containing protein [Undibacterium sp. Jales W-56]MCU6432518.1 hemerythrin domain-containing protein [Undibacterium sp. Jales W-56]